jgi:hypothetical protein
MRFSTVIPSILVVLLLAIFNIAVAEPTVNYNNNGLVSLYKVYLIIVSRILIVTSILS